MARRKTETTKIIKAYIIDDREKEYLVEVCRESVTGVSYVEENDADIEFWKQQDTNNRSEEEKRQKRITEREKLNSKSK